MSTSFKSSYYTAPTACQIIMAVFISPIGVAMRHGCGKELGINLGLYALSFALSFFLSFIAVSLDIPYLPYANPLGIIAWIYGLYVVIKRVDPPAGHIYA